MSCPTLGSWPTSPLVIRSVNAAAQRVRIRHGRKVTVVGRDGGLARQHNPRFDPGVWRARWLFMRGRHSLSPSQRASLDKLLARHPEVGAAWRLKEAFADIYESADRAEAGRRFDDWMRRVEGPGLSELAATARVVDSWREQILNYFDDRQTNAFAEGITNKIKVMKRRGYGHRRSDRYRHKVQHLTTHRPAHPPLIA